MLYDNKPLQQEGIKVSKWSGTWNQQDMQKYDNFLSQCMVYMLAGMH